MIVLVPYIVAVILAFGAAIGIGVYEHITNRRKSVETLEFLDYVDDIASTAKPEELLDLKYDIKRAIRGYSYNSYEKQQALIVMKKIDSYFYGHR